MAFADGSVRSIDGGEPSREGCGVRRASSLLLAAAVIVMGACGSPPEPVAPPKATAPPRPSPPPTATASAAPEPEATIAEGPPEAPLLDPLAPLPAGGCHATRHHADAVPRERHAARRAVRGRRARRAGARTPEHGGPRSAHGSRDRGGGQLRRGGDRAGRVVRGDDAAEGGTPWSCRCCPSRRGPRRWAVEVEGAEDDW
jgi:hypothetical protein